MLATVEFIDDSVHSSFKLLERCKFVLLSLYNTEPYDCPQEQQYHWQILFSSAAVLLAVDEGSNLPGDLVLFSILRRGALIAFESLVDKPECGGDGDALGLVDALIVAFAFAFAVAVPLVPVVAPAAKACRSTFVSNADGSCNSGSRFVKLLVTGTGADALKK